MEALRSAHAVGLLLVRKEVQDFVQAAETLLSPALRTSEFTPEECYIITEYVVTMSHQKQPWSKELPVRYT